MKFTEITQNDIKNTYMLGTLALDEPMYQYTLGEKAEPVSPDKHGNNSVVFYIKPLSPEPKPIADVLKYKDLYIGFDDKSFADVNLGIDYRHANYDLNKRTNILREKLEGTLILYHPVINYKEKIDKHFRNLNVYSFEKTWDKTSTYFPVPRISMTNEELEQSIQNGEPITLKEYNHAMVDTRFLLCGEYLYIGTTEWKRMRDQRQDSKVIVLGDVKKIYVPQEVVRTEAGAAVEHIVFFTDSFLAQMDIDADLLTFTEKVTTIEEKDELQQEKQQVEWQFLNYLDRLAKEDKLSYELEDLIAFHTSVKTNPLNILAGQSGSGKTKLANLYAKALGLKEDNKTLLILPISPSYTEPGDVLGFLNTTTGLYTPSETGLVDFFIEAAKEENQDQLFMVVYDEMNLSQIEHWFSPFISILELEPEQRYLQLYSQKTTCHNSSLYPNRVHIGSNVIMVGTVNMDETTRDLSDRLIDRTDIIKLQRKSFQTARNSFEHNPDEEHYEHLTQLVGVTQTFNSWKSSNHAWDAFSDQELEFFEEIHTMINRADSMKGFSYRNIVRLGDYLNNRPCVPDDALFSRKTAIDLFVLHRILPKIRGPVEVYETLIGTIVDGEVKNGELYDWLSSTYAQTISNFERCKKELLRKAKELKVNGYIA